jgi:anthranilate phosphoribosyltransferase
LAAGDDLTQTEMAEAIDRIMLGHCAPGEIGLLLTLLREKGETCQEIAGAAAALRRHMVPIRSRRTGLLDTCGTGGDGSGTFNISTAAAIVTAAAGVPVAKHGNRKISSRTGSADVLAELGVNISATPAQVERCLDELGLGFCFAPLLHPAMKQVSEVRKSLGVPTIFNLLGPLSNPASAPFQLLGVGRPALRPLLAEALLLLGTQRALVVCGDDGLDEVTLAAETQVTVVEEGRVSETTWSPEIFGLRRTPLATLSVDGPLESAAMIRDVLGGQPGPARDIVLLNVAAALFAAGVSENLGECVERAASSIDTGASTELLAKLGEMSHE